MTRRGAASLLISNARVLRHQTGDRAADTVAIRGDRILGVGTLGELRWTVGAATELVDAAGGLVTNGFHDAHFHLLSYARGRSSLDCRDVRSLAELRTRLAIAARRAGPGEWLRAVGYDELRLAERRHPDRTDLDRAVPDRAVRLQHRTGHLDILNTLAMQATELLALECPEIERDPASGAATGRLYNAAALLSGRAAPWPAERLAADVQHACEVLLGRGITSIADATATNGQTEWALFERLAEAGQLGVRLAMMPGLDHWRDLADPGPAATRVTLGPVKIMLDEQTSDPAAVRQAVAEVHQAGRSVAVHATSAAELAIALDALRTTPRPPGTGPDRIEHGAVIPDALMPAVRQARVIVVGQPALVAERGDFYRAEFALQAHGWLHRARSLLDAGIPYAIGSDAPLTEPDPALWLRAAQQRRAPTGAVLGPRETLTPLQALAACTHPPGCAPGLAGAPGTLAAGARADLVVLDARILDADGCDFLEGMVKLTIAGGVPWRPAAAP
ncbi:MAG: amidohydrolase family protein [Chloroflexi bacterium]|nr:amidohydrolase family protein [Chloroflexota bacterium]